ncbi:MAG: uracil-DNA glycosylase [Candidatus Heimdallarchaeaceae archaeon]
MDLKALFGEEWYNALDIILKSEYWRNLGQKIAKERGIYTIYPEKGSDLLFKAFRTTPLSEVKVVILGQDPYHDGSYDGFAFSNRESLRLSPSLQNILKEVESDIYDGLQVSQNPELERWAKQGVLLINTAHTVRKGNPASHLDYWRNFTSEVLQVLLKQDRTIVWMLWGKKAKRAIEDEPWKPDQEKHRFILSPHPSPFSAHTGFFGSKPFSKANKYLEANGKSRIEW